MVLPFGLVPGATVGGGAATPSFGFLSGIVGLRFNRKLVRRQGTREASSASVKELPPRTQQTSRSRRFVVRFGDPSDKVAW